MSDLNELMDRDPLELSAQDIDDIIAYQRKMRAATESGGGKARKETGPKQKLDLAALGLIPKVVEGPSIKRRV